MKEKTSNIIPNRAVDKVQLAAKLLSQAIDQAQEDKDRQKIVAVMSCCTAVVDQFMFDALIASDNGMALIEKSFNNPGQSMNLSDQLVRAVHLINAVMSRSEVPVPFDNRDKQIGVMERMVNRVSEELSVLSAEFLAIVLAKTDDGIRFMQQALEAANERSREANDHQAIIDRLQPKLEEAIAAINRVIDDHDVPDPDSDHPISHWLINEITEHTRCNVDFYFAKSLSRLSSCRNIIREAIDEENGE